jgi:uncharacterized protein with PhoU and TrkA domain
VRCGEIWHFNPAPDFRIEAGNALIAIVSPDGRRALESAVGATVKHQGETLI